MSLLQDSWRWRGPMGCAYFEGFTKPLPTVLTIIGIAASMWLLGLSTKALPLATAYAVWVGIGVVGSTLLGVVAFGEPLIPLRALFLMLLVVAIVGLKVTAHAEPV